MSLTESKPRLRPKMLPDGRVTVSSTRDLHDAIAAGYSVDRLCLADSTEHVSAARQEGYNEGFAAGRGSFGQDLPTALKASLLEQGALAERARINHIRALTEPGLESFAEEAIENGTALEQFALLQLAEMRDRGITLSAIRADSPKAPPFAASPSDAGTSRKTISAKEVFARRSESIAGAGK